MKIISKEIFLIERYISLDYFSRLRDIWEGMVKHVDVCLNNFVTALPADYRNLPLPEQPDIVWGNRVIPNFRNTLQSLNDGVILLSHGDFSGLNCAHGPLNDFKGQLDFWSGWMNETDEVRYSELLHKAVQMASNITATESASWSPGDLSSDYHEESRGALEPPVNWSMYQSNAKISVASGSKVAVSGIYIPDIENSCAEFLNANYRSAPLARVFVRMKELIAPDTGIKYGEQPEYIKKPCNWIKAEQQPASQETAQAHLVIHNCGRLANMAENSVNFQ